MEEHELKDIIDKSNNWEELYIKTIVRFQKALSLVESTLNKTENPNRYLELKARKNTLIKVIEDMHEISYKCSDMKE